MTVIKGAIHIHSLYSYDGKKSIEEIKHIYKSRGYNFIIMTEHAEKLEDDKFKLFISECKSLSEDDFVIIPGLEFRCKNGLEILGLNISKKLNILEPKKLIELIQEKDGLAILAHPHKYKFSWDYNILKNLNGVEIWNYLYDGKHAPRVTSINLLKSLTKTNKNIFAYCGVDFHDNVHTAELIHYVIINKISSKEIINSLKLGKFYIGNNRTKLNSKAEIKFYEYIWFDFLNLVYDVINTYAIISYKIIQYFGIKTPNFLYKLKYKIL